MVPTHWSVYSLTHGANSNTDGVTSLVNKLLSIESPFDKNVATSLASLSADRHQLLFAIESAPNCVLLGKLVLADVTVLVVKALAQESFNLIYPPHSDLESIPPEDLNRPILGVSGRLAVIRCLFEGLKSKPVPTPRNIEDFIPTVTKSTKITLIEEISDKRPQQIVSPAEEEEEEEEEGANFENNCQDIFHLLVQLAMIPSFFFHLKDDGMHYVWGYWAYLIWLDLLY